MGACKAPHTAAHFTRHGPRHARVDFVEDKNRQPCIPCEYRLQGQHDAADLTTGGDARQWPRVLSQIGRKIKRHMLGSSGLGTEATFHAVVARQTQGTLRIRFLDELYAELSVRNAKRGEFLQ